MISGVVLLELRSATSTNIVVAYKQAYCMSKKQPVSACEFRHL